MHRKSRPFFRRKQGKWVSGISELLLSKGEAKADIPLLARQVRKMLGMLDAADERDRSLRLGQDLPTMFMLMALPDSPIASLCVCITVQSPRCIFNTSSVPVSSIVFRLISSQDTFSVTRPTASHFRVLQFAPRQPQLLNNLNRIPRMIVGKVESILQRQSSSSFFFPVAHISSAFNLHQCG